METSDLVLVVKYVHQNINLAPWEQPSSIVKKTVCYPSGLLTSINCLETKEDYDLAELILKLPNKIKAPIHLFYFEGYKVSEISQILSISISAVKMRLKRGRELLKLELEKDGY